MTIYFRACPKCRGDMLSRTDPFGECLGCIQCGYTLYPAAKRAVSWSAPSRDGKPVTSTAEARATRPGAVAS